MGEAWTVLSTLIAGIGIWGAVGYGLDALFGTRPVIFVIGVLIGHFAAVYLIYIRVNQQEKNRAA
jgi:ATP synthase protein I